MSKKIKDQVHEELLAERGTNRFIVQIGQVPQTNGDGFWTKFRIMKEYQWQGSATLTAQFDANQIDIVKQGIAFVEQWLKAQAERGGMEPASAAISEDLKNMKVETTTLEEDDIPF